MLANPQDRLLVSSASPLAPRSSAPLRNSVTGTPAVVRCSRGWHVPSPATLSLCTQPRPTSPGTAAGTRGDPPQIRRGAPATRHGTSMPAMADCAPVLSTTQLKKVGMFLQLPYSLCIPVVPPFASVSALARSSARRPRTKHMLEATIGKSVLLSLRMAALPIQGACPLLGFSERLHRAGVPWQTMGQPSGRCRKTNQRCVLQYTPVEGHTVSHRLQQPVFTAFIQIYSSGQKDVSGDRDYYL